MTGWTADPPWRQGGGTRRIKKATRRLSGSIDSDAREQEHGRISRPKAWSTTDDSCSKLVQTVALDGKGAEMKKLKAQLQG